MKRNHKELYLNNIINVFTSFGVIILVNFSKINAEGFFKLRKQLKGVEGGLIVIKNSLASIALSKVSNLDHLNQKFQGPVFIVYSNNISSASKVLTEFVKKNQDKANIICASSSKKLLNVKDILFFARLPSSLLDMRKRFIYSVFYSNFARLAFYLKIIAKKNKE